jgi:hypothetical protein
MKPVRVPPNTCQFKKCRLVATDPTRNNVGILPKKEREELGVEAHTCNLSTQETEAGGS